VRAGADELSTQSISTSTPDAEVDSGGLAGLVGTGWGHHYRILHPAYDLVDRALVPVTWAEVAARRGARPDLRTAAWHDVSGFRLHHPRENPVFRVEPRVGPVPGVLGPVLAGLPAGSGGGVWLAEWTGFDESAAGRSLDGCVFSGTATLVGLPHSVWRSTLPAALALIARGDEPGGPGSDALLADVVRDVAGGWIVVSSPDLASTYCATREPVAHWDAGLEWLEVDRAAPVS
jgi:hypothetical protein